MVALCANAQFIDEIRRLAIEVLTELCEKRPQMMRKMTNFPSMVLPAVFALMVEIEVCSRLCDKLLLASVLQIC